MTDRMIRAITADGDFRAVAVRLDEAANGVMDAQRPLAGHEVFAELLVAGVLLRESMAPKYRVQMSLRAPGAHMMADSHPDGMIRGMLSGQGGALPIPGEDVKLHVARLMPEGKLQQGVIESDPRGVSSSLTRYMQRSEQVTSTIGISARRLEGGVRFCSGFMLQLLPDVEPRSLERITHSLESIPEDWAERSAAELVELILQGVEYSVVEETQPFFGCTCSDERVLGALATMGEDDLRAAVEGGETLEIACEYCGIEYAFGSERYATLLD